MIFFVTHVNINYYDSRGELTSLLERKKVKTSYMKGHLNGQWQVNKSLPYEKKEVKHSMYRKQNIQKVDTLGEPGESLCGWNIGITEILWIWFLTTMVKCVS